MPKLKPLDALRALWKPADDAFLEDFTTPQRAVLTVLVIHATADGVCWPSHKTIMNATGFARSTVIQALGELVALGAITRAPKPPQSTTYTVQEMDRPGDGPSRRETVTVQVMDFDRPGDGHELLKELPIELDTSKSAPPIADMWEVWIEELGGKPPHPKLTDKRKKLLATLYLEHLKAESDPLASFRSICRAVLASEHHMGNRTYQMPESLFKNPERRERWYLAGVNGDGRRDTSSHAGTTRSVV